MPAHAQQHYVPKFLLEQWHSGTDDKLTAFRWTHGNLTNHRYKARSVAKAAHLYSMQRSHAQPDVQAERDFLGPQVDEPASIVHKKILDGGVRSLNDADKRRWSVLLVSLLIRIPTMMQHMRERGSNVLSAGLDESPEEYDAIRGDTPEATLREWVAKNQPDVMEDLAVMTLPHLVFSQLLNGALLRAKWATRPLKRSRFDLLISDQPLTYAGTFETRFLVGLPLSPQLAFLAFNDDQTWDKIMAKSDSEFARDANLSSVTGADTYVYATGVGQEAFVRKYLRKR